MTVQKEKKAEYDSAIAALKSDFSEQLNRLREEAAENEKELTGQIHALMAELAQKKEELIGTSTGKAALLLSDYLALFLVAPERYIDTCSCRVVFCSHLRIVRTDSHTLTAFAHCTH